MDILTLEAARAALGWQDGQNPDREAELTALYIPAVNNFVTKECPLLLAPTPEATLAAQQILAQLWNSDKQGRAAGSSVRAPSDVIPAGFLVPNRAALLLAPYGSVVTFA